MSSSAEVYVMDPGSTTISTILARAALICQMPKRYPTSKHPTETLGPYSSALNNAHNFKFHDISCVYYHYVLAPTCQTYPSAFLRSSRPISRVLKGQLTTHAHSYKEPTPRQAPINGTPNLMRHRSTYSMVHVDCLILQWLDCPALCSPRRKRSNS